jgi:hypothetical protein
MLHPVHARPQRPGMSSTRTSLELERFCNGKGCSLALCYCTIGVLHDS